MITVVSFLEYKIESSLLRINLPREKCKSCCPTGHILHIDPQKNSLCSQLNCVNFIISKGHERRNISTGTS